MNLNTVSNEFHLESEIGFGKHARQTYEWVYRNDLDYYEWMKRKGIWPSPIRKKEQRKRENITDEPPPIRVGNRLWIGIRVIDCQ